MALILVHGLQTQRAISAFPLHLLLLVLVRKENFLLFTPRLILMRRLITAASRVPGAVQEQLQMVLPRHQLPRPKKAPLRQLSGCLGGEPGAEGLAD